ncbi:non-ribosomal peptide synthetase [Chitinophaga sp. GbtcB8]|uniref:non-ribosomal peptide synthetase n=1 Tax=Chitinophaga sp. GbtcB8 TaxID=2824753 RepID=UPI001C30E812|nr:non-ribosomal peptide synthetase [Chitinophaga sp. GbtcB8]
MEEQMSHLCNHEFALDMESVALIRKYARNRDQEIFVQVLSVLAVMCCKLNNTDDITIYIPAPVQDHASRQQAPLLPVRLSILPGDSIKDIIQRTGNAVQIVYRNMSKIIRQLEDSHQPVKHVAALLSFKGLHPVVKNEGFNGMEFFAAHHPGGISINIRYPGDAFSEAYVRRITSYFNGIAAEFRSLEKLYRDLSYIPAGEREQLINGFNNTDSFLPAVNLMQLLEERAFLDPGKKAVMDEQVRMTYGELYRTSCKVAAHLIQYCGVKKGDIIVTCLDRSYLSAVGMMGTLLAGGIYLPVSPDSPEARFLHILEDTSAKVIISSGKTPAHREATVCIDIRSIITSEYPECMEFDLPYVAPQEIAYIIYTSGSTGKPKGVPITHEGIINTILDDIKQFEVGPGDVYLQFFNHAFDGAVRDMLMALASGAALYIASRATINDVRLMLDLIRREKVTITSMTPSYIRLLDRAELSGLRVLMSGGEAAYTEDLVFYARHFTVCNMYGPSENAVVSTKYIVNKDKTYPDSIPIGYPVSNTRIYILDKDRKLLPQGCYGEICIAGTGLTSGYLSQPEATRNAFFEDHSLEGSIIYKSGDVGRWNEDGTLSFLGRSDEQVKINGFRIELNEIRSVTIRHHSVRDAAFLVDNQKKLYGFVETTTGAADVTAVKQYLQQALPSYMQPHKLVCVSKIPVTDVGKTDKEKLLELIAQKVWIADVNETSPEGAILLDALKHIFNDERITLEGHFFEMGGDSLKAITLSAYLSDRGYDCRVEQILETPVLKEIALLLKAGKEEDRIDIVRVEESEYYPVSHAQRRIWALNQLQEEAGYVYNVPDAWMLEGEIVVPVLLQSFRELVARHEILRTTFTHNANSVMQQVHPFDPDSCDFKYLDEVNAPDKFVAAEAILPFDLEKGPLLRLRLFKISDRQYVLLLIAHHIIIDAWSCSLFYKELLALYDATLNNRKAALPTLHFQQKDYAAWHNSLVEKGSLPEQRQFWRSAYSAIPQQIQLNRDWAGEYAAAFSGDTIKSTFSAKQSGYIHTFIGRHDMSPYMFFVALVNVLLFKYTGQPVIVTGTPFSNREIRGLEDQIGFYVNMLPIKIDIDGEQEVVPYLLGVRDIISSVHKNQQYPVDVLIDELDLPFSTTPLFNIVITWLDEAQRPAALTGGGLKALPYPFEFNISKYDLTFSFTRNAQGLYEIQINYKTACFQRDRITRMIGHFHELVQQIPVFDRLRIHELNILPAAEVALLRAFNNTTVEKAAAFSSVIAVFETQTAGSPEKTAVFYGDSSYSYADVDATASRIAAYLLQQKNLDRQSRIGVMMQPSFFYVGTFAGILKANCIYVPLDPNDPAERINYIVKDAGLKLIFTNGINTAGYQGITTELTDVEAVTKGEIQIQPSQICSPDDLAYIIYTSGTTGRPKGVKVSHAALFNFCSFHNSVFNIKAGHASMLYSSLTFDAAIWELWPYLMAGAGIYPLPAENRLDVAGIADFLTLHKLTHCFLPPVILDQLLTWNKNRYIETVTIHTGGDRIRPNKKLRHYKIVNNYGLTETTVIATSTLGEDLPAENRPLTIGKPFAFAEIFILDTQMKMLPVGVTGEICVMGGLLANGYLHDEDLQSKKFVASAYGAGKLFRTGDYGYWTNDGQIVFEGRMDSQVQLNGKRVELEEVQQVLNRFEGIDQVVVYTRELSNNNPVVAACYTGPDTIAPSALKMYAALYLPQHMIPAYFKRVDNIPLTGSGKIDYKALPGLEKPAVDTGYPQEQPDTPVKMFLGKIFSEMLQVEQIDYNTSFFDLGANSVSLIAIHNKIKPVYPSFRVLDLFSHHNINSLSTFLEYQQMNLVDDVLLTDVNAITPDRKFLSEDITADGHYHFSLDNIPGLKRLAAGWGVSLEDMLVGGFLYSLNLIAAADTIPLHIADGMQDSSWLINVNFDQVENEQGLFREVNRQMTGKSAAGMGLDQLEKIKFTKADPQLLTACVLLQLKKEQKTEAFYRNFDLIFDVEQLTGDTLTCSLVCLNGSNGVNYISAVSGHMARLFYSMKEMPLEISSAS